MHAILLTWQNGAFIMLRAYHKTMYNYRHRVLAWLLNPQTDVYNHVIKFQLHKVAFFRTSYFGTFLCLSQYTEHVVIVL